MRLERLVLTAFGRFAGKALELGPGLNVIYGPNEAGKSTLQQFLCGMLYGFKRPGVRRAYTEELARYRPWTGGDYRGALIYTLEGERRYRVERVFEPEREEVRVYDEATGADLTASFPMDRRKELRFAEAHLGMGEELFAATAWVGQMQVGRVEMGRELADRLTNLQEAGREDLSVQSALAWLEERAREIGSERAPTRPYGRALRAIAQKRAELERAEQLRQQVRAWEVSLSEVRSAMAAVEAELEEAGRRLEWARLREAEGRLRRAEAARERVRELRAQADALADYASFPAEREGRLREWLAAAETAEARVERHRARLEGLAAQQEELRREMARYPEMASVGPQAAAEVAAAVEAERAAEARLGSVREEERRLAEEAEGLRIELAGLVDGAAPGGLGAGSRSGATGAPGPGPRIPGAASSGAPALGTPSPGRAPGTSAPGPRSRGGRRRQPPQAAATGGGAGWLWAALALAGLAVVAALALPSPWRWTIAASLALAAAGCGLRYLAVQRQGQEAAEEERRARLVRAEQLTARLEALQERLGGLREEAARLEAEAERQRLAWASVVARGLGLTEAEVAGDPGAVDRFRRAYYAHQDLARLLGAVEREAAEAEAEAAGEADRAERARTAAAELLAAAGVADPEAFAEGVAQRQAYERALREAEALEAALRGRLGGEDPAALAAEVERLRGRVRGEEPPADLPPAEALREEAERLAQRRAELEAQARDLSARVETALADAPDSADLRREMEALEAERAAYEEELAAIDLARQTIAEVAAEVHRDFAPRLNEAMGAVLARLTGGRYRTVRVDETLTIRAIDGDGRTVPLTSLSAGTVDQFYLGLRLALLDLLTGGAEPVPLLLDDPFVQYDDRRAKDAIAFLAEAAQSRQVLLLTCHQREVRLAQEADPEARIIDIGEAEGA